MISGAGGTRNLRRDPRRANHLLWVALCALAMLISPTAFADDWDDEDGGFVVEGGNYFSVGFSWVAEEVDNEIGKSSKDKGFHVVDDGVQNAEGINAVFGRRAIDYAAVELQFEYADGFQFKDTDGDHFDIKVYTTTFNAKVFAFHNLLRSVNEGRIQPHLLGGFGIMVTQDLDIDPGAAMTFRAGAGLDYFINDKWVFNVKSSYVHPVGNLDGLNFITSSVGFSYQLE
jgi:hypothetical protein